MHTMNNNVFDIIIIGGGPAGLAAGIYAARAKMRTLILNEGATGGQLVLTHEIANYPGVESTSGYELASRMATQAKSFGCQIKSNRSITRIDLEGELKTVETNGSEVWQAPAIILAPGGRSKELGVPGEKEFRGKGISYCATCDGDFFTGKDIIVVGGGNSALEEAVSLTKYARSVTIIHIFDHFQAFQHAVDEAEANEKISFILNSRITTFGGKESLEYVEIENISTGNRHKKAIDGVFIFIGYRPNTEFLAGNLPLTEQGELEVTQNMETAIPGIFAAGDSIKKRFRQVTTAVADGTVAALAASEYVNTIKKTSYATH